MIEEGDRQYLLSLFKPSYPDVIAHHVTERPGVPKDSSPPEAADVVVIGYAKGEGIEALVVQVNGTTDRPIGGTYHITWSLDAAAGFKPVDSNRLIKEEGFQPIVLTIPIKTVPKVFY